MARIIEEIILRVRIDDRRAKSSLKDMRRETREASKESKKFMSNLEAIGKGVIALGLWRLAKASATLNARFEAVNNSLKVTTGNVVVAEKEMSFLTETSDRLGVNLLSSAESYSKFLAATKGTAISADQTREIFMGVTEASVALGISADDTAGALKAIQQIASKGRVSLEELTGQLGERLPNAMQLLADELGVTRSQLIKMTEDGQLMAEDVLPALGRAFRREFGEAAVNASKEAQAELNRLSNSWEGFLNRIGKGANKLTPALRAPLEAFNIASDLLIDPSEGSAAQNAVLAPINEVVNGINGALELFGLLDDEIKFSASETAASLKPIPEALEFAKKSAGGLTEEVVQLTSAAKKLDDIFAESQFIEDMESIQESLQLDDTQFKRVSKFIEKALEEAGDNAEAVFDVMQRIYEISRTDEFKKLAGDRKIFDPTEFDDLIDKLKKREIELQKNVFDDAIKNFDKAFEDLDLAEKFNIPADQFNAFRRLIEKAREQGFGEEEIINRLEQLDILGVLGKKNEAGGGMVGGTATALRAGTSDVSQFIQGQKLNIANWEANKKSADNLEQIRDLLVEQGFRAVGGAI